jgi:SAM-dependent methyltransferase
MRHMLYSSDGIRTALREHLAQWGLQRFTTDHEYFAWQRRRLPAETLTQLNSFAERKRHGDRRDEMAFYDLAARPNIHPVLYSQRYGYFEEVGPRVACCLGGSKRALDFGCGTGILTTFYARLCPGGEFVGIDRSTTSVAVAGQKANELGLKNIRFECVDAEDQSLAGSYDTILSTHALVQAEHDPGIPSASWRTFDRRNDTRQQEDFERRTGIGTRLDQINAVLDRNGRLVVCEKTRQLARRVPFQRALAARGFQMIESPAPIQYRLIDETVDDGPLFVLRKGNEAWLVGDEWPDPDEGMPFDQTAIRAGSGTSDQPLYENHWPSAQRVWERLENRQVIEETTSEEPDGRQLHVELGTSGTLAYLYCANTFDHRQVVIVNLSRMSILEAYYREIVEGKS